MFIVFKVYSKTSPHNYYGYTRLHDVKEGFLQGAIRPEHYRGDARFLAAHGGRMDSLIFEELEIFDTELEAWMYRNDCRAADKFAFTGPSVFPPNVAARVAKQYPERMADWQHVIATRHQQNVAKTARQAWTAGRWTQQAVKDLLKIHKRDQVVKDLDFCSPNAFAKKYSLA